MDKQEEKEQLRLAAEVLLETVYWMSGSGDFAPTGRARKGWLKAGPYVEAAAAILLGEAPGA